jgi:hypothetical protein
MLIGSAGDRGTIRIRFPRQLQGKPNPAALRLRDRTHHDNGPQEMSKITPDEWTTLAQASDRVPVFIAAYVPAKSRSRNELPDLDKACAAWLRAGKRDRFSLEDVTLLVGCALGNQVIREFGGDWVRLGNWRKSGFAISPNHLVPFESVRENLKAGRVNFIGPLYGEMQQSMKR